MSKCLPQLRMLRMVLFSIRFMSILALPLACNTFLRVKRLMASLRITMDGPSGIGRKMQNIYQAGALNHGFIFVTIIRYEEKFSLAYRLFRFSL